jgi:transposase
MIRIDLTPEETSQRAPSRRRRRSQVAERCHSVLLNAQGWRVPQIAQRFERHAPTIRQGLKASHTQGLAGLDNAPPPGRPARKGQQRAPQLETLLAQPPGSYGYLDAGWTVELLRDSLSSTFALFER